MAPAVPAGLATQGAAARAARYPPASCDMMTAGEQDPFRHMICSQCQTSYRSEPGEIAAGGTLAGLCERCGTEPRYGAFVRSFGKTLLAAVISVEVLIVAAFFAGWWGIVSLVVIGSILYLLVRSLVLPGDTVRYRKESDRKSRTRGQRFLGLVAGIAAGLGLFRLYLDAL